MFWRNKKLAIFVLFLFVCLSFGNSVYGQQFMCGEDDYEGLETKCVNMGVYNKTTNKLDGIDADYEKYGEYYKCIDSKTSCADTQRCCVRPLEGQYGGQCFNPTTSREAMGIESSGNKNTAIFDFLRPQNCDKKLDAIPENTYAVIIELEEGAFAKQAAVSLKESDIRGNPKLEIKPNYETYVFETTINSKICRAENLAECPADTIGITPWYYGLDEAGRSSFFYLKWEGQGLPTTLFPSEDPRDDLGTTDKVGCYFANAIKTPFFNAASNISRYFTNADNMPDIAMLCSQGTPVFTDPEKAVFTDGNGKIQILDPKLCRCSDSTSSPANSSVLLCTKYVTGVGDNNPWRSVIPDQFNSLLFGGIQNTNNASEMRNSIKSDYDGFMNNQGAIINWIQKIDVESKAAYFPDASVIRTRLFGEEYKDRYEWYDQRSTKTLDVNKIAGEIPKNAYAKEYISCLACAKYGGFQSALGCMPMDKVQRFISEGIMTLAISIGGAACILCLIYGALLYQFSMGESSKIQKAQKLITGCLLGLITIIFALFILRFVGVDLLRIPFLG